MMKLFQLVCKINTRRAITNKTNSALSNPMVTRYQPRTKKVTILSERNLMLIRMVNTCTYITTKFTNSISVTIQTKDIENFSIYN
jgi:hypothetical protein